ncbi:Tubulin-specific chaperone A [Aphelenchoides bicaudatus]|nr:Tubulin-specific chaperone A [Aphelenchoides bicaudatus]
MADAKLLRELTIKSNVVKRLIKEVQSYEKEVEKDRERVKKMEAADPDDYNIKKAKEQLQETLQMIPLVSQKLHSAVKDLQDFLAKNAEVLEGTGELQQAQEHIAASEAIKL